MRKLTARSSKLATSASTRVPSPPRSPRNNGVGALEPTGSPADGGPSSRQSAHHAPLADERSRDLGGDDRQRQLIDAPGVDAAEQRVDEPLDNLPAEPAFEDRGGVPLGAFRVAGAGPSSDGSAVAAQSHARGRDRSAAAQEVEGRPGDPGSADDPGTGESLEVGRDAEDQAGGQGPKATPGEDRCRARRRRDEIFAQTDLAAQLRCARVPRQEIVRPEVDRAAPKLSGEDLAAEALIRLQDDDLDLWRVAAGSSALSMSWRPTFCPPTGSQPARTRAAARPLIPPPTTATTRLID